jgi:hypothetical protein
MVVLAAGFTLASRAHADNVLLQYRLLGTFDDGSTFSGSFGYDPVNNVYAWGIDTNFGQMAYGDFDVATTSGTQGLGGHFFDSGLGTTDGGYSDAGSDPLSLRINGGSHYSFANLVFAWANPLNGPGGAELQAIIGGQHVDYANCNVNCLVRSRNVTGGYVMLESAPVPLPAAAWLLLSGGVGLAGILRSRRLDQGATQQ